MTDRPAVFYAREPNLGLAVFRRVLLESGLGASRPIEDKTRLGAMLSGANFVVTARVTHAAGEVVGVARGVTDFAWCCYIAELAVCASARGLGIGRGLLDEARNQLGPRVSIILASVPEAVGFYESAGMTRVPDAFWYRRTE
jgi:ribosomal protein S18 acetylase RimI-like enzyme